MTMRPSIDSISLKLTHCIDENGEYKAFTSVAVDIVLDQHKIGHISATLVDRQLIPKDDFFSAMDRYSGDLQWIAVTLFEHKYGRTILQSLANHDDPEFLIMYISKLHLEPEFKQDSDIAASAIRKLLVHPFIKGTNVSQNGTKKVSCAIYILDSLEQMTPSQEEDTLERHEADTWRREVQEELSRSTGMPETTSGRMRREGEQQANEQQYEQLQHTLARTDANAFLRAGFFQDPFVARLGGDSGNLLVASHGDWTKPSALLWTHAEARAVIFTNPPPTLVGAAVGHDAEILDSGPAGAHKKVPSSGHANTAEWSGGLQEPGFVNYFAEDRQHDRMMGHHSSSDDSEPRYYYIEERGKHGRAEASSSCDEIAGGDEPGNENQIKKQKM
jgi:hypothetical protein